MKQHATAKKTRVCLSVTDGATDAAPLVAPENGKFTEHALRQILSDAQVSEQKWMSACVLAGEKNLSAPKRHPYSLVGEALCIFLSISAFFVLPVAAFVCAAVWQGTGGHFAAFTMGANLDSFMRQCSAPTVFGSVLAFIGSLQFWMGLTIKRESVKKYVSCILAGLTLALTCSKGWLAVAAFGPMTLLAVFLPRLFGEMLAEHMPKSSPVERIPPLMVLPVLWLMVWLISNMHGSSDSHVWGAASGGGAIVFGGALLWILLSPPAMVLAFSKVRSKSSAIFMSLVLQSPVLIAMAATLAALLVAAVSSSTGPDGLALAISQFSIRAGESWTAPLIWQQFNGMLGTCLLAVAALIGGSALLVSLKPKED